ncbi:hypothetical protein [Crenobacter luteus]|nr:hypothetical protein [Crenobacter luteus]
MTVKDRAENSNNATLAQAKGWLNRTVAGARFMLAGTLAILRVRE